MKIRFLKPAQSEVDDSVVWYDSQSFGLGTQFLDDLDRAVRRIVRYPLSCPEIEPNPQALPAFKISYGLIYGVDADTIIVVAVSHLHREPRYWINRILNEGK